MIDFKQNMINAGFKTVVENNHATVFKLKDEDSYFVFLVKQEVPDKNKLFIGGGFPASNLFPNTGDTRDILNNIWYDYETPFGTSYTIDGAVIPFKQCVERIVRDLVTLLGTDKIPGLFNFWREKNKVSYFDPDKDVLVYFELGITNKPWI